MMQLYCFNSLEFIYIDALSNVSATSYLFEQASGFNIRNRLLWKLVYLLDADTSSVERPIVHFPMTGRGFTSKEWKLVLHAGLNIGKSNRYQVLCVCLHQSCYRPVTTNWAMRWLQPRSDEPYGRLPCWREPAFHRVIGVFKWRALQSSDEENASAFS